MPSNMKENQIQISFVTTKEEHKRITDKQKQYGFKTLAEYMRFVSLNAEISVQVIPHGLLGGIEIKQEVKAKGERE